MSYSVLLIVVVSNSSKLHADARNIAFFYKKKKGVINMMDVSGLLEFCSEEVAVLSPTIL